MAKMSAQLNLLKSLIRDPDSGLIVVGVQDCLDCQSAPCARAADQIDHRFKVQQGPASPVQTDEGEETMLDLIPLAGARRIVTDGDRDGNLVRELLQFHFPGSHPVAI